jgi:hypothetical protein
VLFGSTFTAGAAVVGVRIVRSIRLVQAQRHTPPAPAHSPRAASSIAPTVTPPEVAAEVSAPESASPPPEVPLAPVALPESAPAAPHGAPVHRLAATGGLSGESRLLHDALEQLNVYGDAASALAQLDSYRHSYPNGVLTREADVARVDALLRLGHDTQALDLLDSAADRGFVDYPRPGQLRVLRGELLARLGRCGEAIPVFSSALADPQAGEAAERALYGRASCRASLGEGAASRSDLNRYLELYPQGHFAAEARRALER